MLNAAFPEVAMRVGQQDEALVVIPAKHHSVGDLVIHDEGDELTVLLGSITHRHFCSQDSSASPEAQAEGIAFEVTTYLRQVFADEIEFYGTGGSGGATVRSDKRRGILSRLLLGKKSYVWSGPLSD